MKYYLLLIVFLFPFTEKLQSQTVEVKLLRGHTASWQVSPLYSLENLQKDLGLTGWKSTSQKNTCKSVLYGGALFPGKKITLVSPDDGTKVVTLVMSLSTFTKDKITRESKRVAGYSVGMLRQ